jgi:hypothetical protein
MELKGVGSDYSLDVYTTSTLLLSKALALKLASIFAGLWCHGAFDATVVVCIERGRVLLRLSGTLRTELVASYSIKMLAKRSTLHDLVRFHLAYLGPWPVFSGKSDS